MNPRAKQDVTNHTFEEFRTGSGDEAGGLEIGDLNDVRLDISAVLGSCKMMVRDVLELKRGSVIQLDKLAGEMTDIHVNGLPLARGEVVVIGDSLHVRIGEIIGDTQKQDDSLGPIAD